MFTPCFFFKREPTMEELAQKRKIKQVQFLMNLYANEIEKYSKKRHDKLKNDYMCLSKNEKKEYINFKEYLLQNTLECINQKKIEDYIKKKNFEEVKNAYEKISQKPFYDNQGNKTREFLEYILYNIRKEENAEYFIKTGEPIFNDLGEKNNEYLEFQAQKAHLLFNNEDDEI